MVNALKSVLRSPLFALLCKVVLWAASLIFLRTHGLGFSYVALVLLLFLWIYLGNRSGRHEFTISFIAILALSLGIVFYVTSLIIFYVALVFLAIALFLLTSVNDLLVLNRRFFYRLTQFMLFFFISLFFLAISDPNIFFIKYCILCAVFFLLFYEALMFLGSRERGLVSNIMVALGVSLVALEFVWVLSLLPLGLLNAASLLVFIIFTMWDFFVLSLENKITWPRIYNRALGLAFVTLIVLLITKWGI